INEWTRTNVYVVNDTLEIGNQTRLDINKGAIIKCHTNAALSLTNGNPDAYPWYSIIADGSAREGIKFTHVSDIHLNHIDGQTPNGGDGKWGGLNLNGPGDICSFKSSIFLKMDSINLSGAGASFYKSNFGASSSPAGSSFLLSLKNKDFSRFYSNTFHMIQPCHVELSEKAVNLFESNDFEFNFDYGAGTGPQDYLVSAASNSTLIARNNDFGKKYQSTSLFNGSKIKLSSTAYISGNVFQNYLATGNQSNGASVEVSVLSSGGSFALPVIENNVFESCKCAIAISGDGFDTTSAILENKIMNNSFVKCGRILYTTVSASGDFASSPTNAAVDSDGNIYMSDSGANCIYKYSPNGNMLMKFGGYGSGDGQFNSPAAVALNDAGEIYVADKGNKRIQKFDKNGKFILKFGTP
ncbi:MAG TPA: hypothetical protein PKL57_20125, partial [Candidatus Wallbacteria bacterium]|nr:hypothetical protein [Candidatus Wallbacteria bacterium]